MDYFYPSPKKLKKNPHQFDVRKVCSTLFVSCLVFFSIISVAPYLYAESKIQALDPQQPPPWSQWELLDLQVEGPETDPYQPLSSGPTSIVGSLAPYKISSQDNPVTVALKIDDMLGALSQSVVHSVTQGTVIQGALPQRMMNISVQRVSSTDRMYADLNAVYGDIDGMKKQLTRNYDTYNNSRQTAEFAQEFNAQSDMMADRVAGMAQALQGMKQRVEMDQGLFDGMFSILDEMSEGGKDAGKHQEQLVRHVKDVSAQFEVMVKDLDRQGLTGTGSIAQTRQYLNDLQEYVKGTPPYTAVEIGYLQDVKKYLQNTRDYLGKVLQDFDKTAANLKENEVYFRKARVSADLGSREIVAADSAADVCESAETKGLSRLKDCAKSCRGGCRWKEKVDGEDCYECPSGSPDSCFDAGAWPSDHPWCAPGGVCHDDPMLYCTPFGTFGPNKEPLSCTNCKQRPDMCWQNVADGTMTYTNCKLGCWDGQCVYKGKYKETEWDGSPEFIHCYECETPPGPPSCEDLGWGYTWISDCEKNCPAPGQCEMANKKVPGGPPASPEPPAGPGEGPADGPAEGGDSGGDTGTRDAEGAGEGKKPTPPTGTPTQPDGGGGSVAGGPKPEDDAPATGGPDEKKTEHPPEDPSTTQPRQPDAPNPEGQPKPPEPPSPPPDNASISFYRKWLEETKERIKTREDIIADPNEGEYTRAEAGSQLETMTREKEHVEERVKEEEKKELDRRTAEEAAKRRAEEYERTRPRTGSFADEMRTREREYKLKRLKDATEALRTKLEEARDVITARRERLRKIDDEIERLERENHHYTTARESGNVDEGVAETRVRDNTARINELKKVKAELGKKLREAREQFDEELTRLKADYRRALWSVDENARRKVEAERMDEYFERYNELQRREQTREFRRQTFESTIKSLENALAEAEAKGDSGQADELRRQIENIKRTQAEWDETLERQINTIKDHLRELEIRNGYEGVGPDSPEELSEQLKEYDQFFQNQIANTRKAIEVLEGLGGARTPEQDGQLKNLKNQVDALRGAIDGVKAKQQEVANGSRLSAEEARRIHDSTTRVAAGAMNQDADKSIGRLIAESIAEEAVHNLNPYVAAKKSLAFGIGVAQGVGSAVVGLVDLGVEALDTVAEAIAVDLGAEDGWIFGTDNLDALNSALDTVSSNANFDGVIKAVVAAGGAIDAQLKELEKGDIDWNTAKFGGRVTGEVIVGDALIAAAVGKASTALRGVDEAADALNAGQRAAGAAEDAVVAGRTAERAGEAASHLEETVKFPPFEPPPSGVTGVDDAASAGRAAGKADDLPSSAPRDAPTARGPPDPVPSPGAAPGTAAAPTTALDFVSEAGQPVSLKAGEKLGAGSTSTVYVNADDPGKVIRVTRIGGDVAEAATLDKFGREALENLGDTDALRVAKRYEAHTVQNTPGSPLNNKVVEVNERMFQGTAKDVLAKQGGQMTSGQAKAFDQATRELNERGLAWLDNHSANYTFEKLPGEDAWRVVIIDTGGVVPMKGSTLAEKADNARAIQSRINAPSDEFKKSMNMVKNNPGLRDMVAGEEWNNIIQDMGHTIDVDTLGVGSPSDVAFRPDGPLKHEEVQSLFKAR